MKFLSPLRATLAGACLIILSGTASYAADLTLTWDPPTTNADGSPVTDLKGYRVYFGTSTGNYTQNTDAGNQTSMTVGNLADDTTYYFAVTAYDSAGIESDYSNEVSQKTAATAPAPAPAPAPDPTPTPSPTPAPTPPPVVGGVAKGDVDSDGVVGMPDVLAVLQMAVGYGVFSQEMQMRADVWPLDSTGKPLGDGKVTIDDCLSILRHVVNPATW